MDPKNTDRLLSLMKSSGRYSCKTNCRLYNIGKAIDRAEYEKRAYNNPPRPEDVQIMRYLARMDYADIYLLTMAAEAHRSERGNNGIVDSMYIRQILKKLLDIGMVHERRYINDAECDAKGHPLTTDKTPIFYCLSGYGQYSYKDLTMSTEFLQEFLFNRSDIEIMRRLAGNYAVMKCLKDFNGKYYTASSEKFDKLGRMPIYGKYENEEHIVIFEPAFFDYNPSYVLEEDFRKYIRLRTKFIERVFETAPAEKTKSLVLLIENRDHLKEAVLTYENVAELTDHIYVTSEFALYKIYDQDGNTCNAFLRAKPADDGKISIIAEKPVFLK